MYVTDEGHKVVDKFTSEGEYIGQITAKTVAAAPGGVFLLRGLVAGAKGEAWLFEESLETTSGEPDDYIDRFSDAPIRPLKSLRSSIF